MTYVTTYVSEVPFKGSTQEPLTCGKTPSVHPEAPSIQEQITSSDDGMDYDHDSAFEVYHTDKPFTLDICSHLNDEFEGDNTEAKAVHTEAKHPEATAEANTEDWMESDLSISFEEAKHLVRQEYLSTLAGSTHVKN